MYLCIQLSPAANGTIWITETITTIMSLVLKNKAGVLGSHSGSELCSSDFDEYFPYHWASMTRSSIWLSFLNI